VMMLDYIGWGEAAASIEKALTRTIAAKTVTYDFARLMEGATKVSTSEFASRIVENLSA
jgi:isocitrate dehydrogenase